MNENKGLISSGADIARRNKRYVVWFYLLNLLFTWFGVAAFSTLAHGVLDHSLYADKLVHGFDLAVLIELLSRPEFGPMQTSSEPAILFALLFWLASMIFMPGVLLGYSSDHRIPRGEFYRACGRNIWRFVRLFLIFSIIVGIICGILLAIQNAVVKAADQTSYERLPFFTQMIGLTIIFLVLTSIRIWFDLAQTDVVLADQPAVRRSLAYAFRQLKRNFGRLIGSYVLIAFISLGVLVGGIVLWNTIVPPASVFGAFLISQLILLVLLAMRFWQRACAVALYIQQGLEPVIETQTALAVATSQ
jgi:hypothetical protein